MGLIGSAVDGDIPEIAILAVAIERGLERSVREVGGDAAAGFAVKVSVAVGRNRI